jgi:hypothetical protein
VVTDPINHDPSLHLMAYNRNQIESLWVQEGGDPKAAPVAAAVALAESGGNPSATNHNTNGTVDKGLFQINSIHGPLSSYDLAKNVRAAIKISNGGRDWTPWVTYKTGAFRRYLGRSSASSRILSRSPMSTTRTVTKTIPGQSFAAERGAAVQSFLGSGRNDAQNNLDFALQIRGLQDTPSRTVSSQVPIGTAGNPSGLSGSSIGGIQQRANALNAQHLPYQWGGGHGSTHVNPYKAVPVDCSGAVSSVLGIDPRVSGEFEKFGKPGTDPGGVTIYANGHHVLMSIGGHFFGTSASNPGGGAGWIPKSQISPAYLKGFVARHL